MKSSNLQRIWIQQRQECVSLTIMDIYIGITSGQMTVILKTEAIIVRGLFCDHMIIHIHAGIFTTPVHLPHKISQFFGQYTSTMVPMVRIYMACISGKRYAPFLENIQVLHGYVQ